MSNASTPCLGPALVAISDHMCYVAYVILTPIYFFIGVTSRSICLIAFCKQYKKEKAFGYQIAAAINEILEVIAVTMNYCALGNFAGKRMPGAKWYLENYALMWMAAHAVAPLHHTFMTGTLLVSLIMATDRLFAILKPFEYKSANHTRLQVTAAILAFLIGLSTSLFDAFRYNVRPNGDLYELATDKIYVASTASTVLAQLRTAVRVIANVALVICNIAMLISYKSKFAQVISSTETNNDRAAKRKSAHKTLLLLTVCQSVSTTLNLTVYNVHYSLIYSIPTFTDCMGNITAPLCALVLLINGILGVFALALISKQLRRMMLAVISCKRSNTTTAG